MPTTKTGEPEFEVTFDKGKLRVKPKGAVTVSGGKPTQLKQIYDNGDPWEIEVLIKGPMPPKK